MFVVIFTLFYCFLDLSCGECNVISMCFLCCSVIGSVCLVCCISDSVQDVWVWVEVLCWIDRVWSSSEYVCCACDPSVHLDAPFIGCVCVCWKLSPYLGI